MNSLEELFFLYPKYDEWDDAIVTSNRLENLSENPTLSWKMISSNPDLPWVWEEISKHPNITWQMIKDNQDLPWDWTSLLQNPNITWKLMHENRKLFWDSTELEEIELDLNLMGPCDKVSIDKHLEIMKQKKGQQYQRLLTFLRWEMTILSEVSIPCWEMIQKNPYMGWDFRKLSTNPNITWQIIQSFPMHIWNWSNLSCNPGITWQIIVDNIDCPWILHDIAENPTIPSDILAIIVEKYVDSADTYYPMPINPMPINTRIQNCNFKCYPMNLNWHKMSKHPNLTLEIIQNNPTRRWYNDEIAQNPNITWEMFPSLFKKYGNGISANPTVTWDIVVDNPDLLWNYYLMSTNPNMYHEDVIENLWKGWWFELICPHHNTWNELCELGLNKWLTFGESKNLA